MSEDNITTTRIPEPQLVRWGPVDGTDAAGIFINRRDGQFIPWTNLKAEVEGRLLNQVRNIPLGSTVTLADFHGRKNWIMQILDPAGKKEIGHVWFGPDPYSDWAYDGLVRLGSVTDDLPIVWQVFQRYADGFLSPH